MIAGLCGCPVEGYAPADSDVDSDATSQDAGGDLGPDAAGDGGDRDASSDIAGDADRQDASDAGDVVAADAARDTDAGSTTCVPERDGRITRDEVIFEPGLTAIFKSAEDVTVDTAGEEQGDGTRHWDLTGPYDGDSSVLIELMSLDGKWYKPEFPDATYASKLADGEDEVGVFEATEDALLLQGVVTPDESTNLKYDPGAKLLEFPLEVGVSWSTESDVDGTYLYNPWTMATEEYQSQVDARGTLETPYGELPVLRVRTVLTRTVGFQVTTIRTFSFVSECFGTVATITSTDNEDQAEFTEASSVRRLAR